jgi:hypothetical protein
MADSSADTTGNHGDIYLGDPISLSSGLAIAADSNDANIVGVCVGIGYERDSFGETGPFDAEQLTRRYGDHLESGTETIWVYYAPALDVVFEAQTAGVLALVKGDAVDTNIVAATAHGSRATSRSNVELVTNVNSDCRVYEVPEYPDNDTSLINARYWVVFVDPLYGAAR